MSDELPHCCVCGEWQVPRRAVLWTADGATVLASLCTDAAWCQVRAAGRKFDGLPMTILAP